MSQFFAGFTKCVVCGLPILAEDNNRLFPAFLPESHPLFLFSDVSFHADCLEQWEHSTVYLQYYMRWKEIMTSRPLNLKTLEERQNWHREAFAIYTVTNKS